MSQEHPTGKPLPSGRGAVTIWLKYVPHNRLLVHLAQGWTIVDDMQGTSHGQWSTLCEWRGDGEPWTP